MNPITMTQVETLARKTPYQKIMHDIRLVNAVYHPDTGRFGHDERDHVAQAKNGKIISNLFQNGTALVASQDGTVLCAVSARNATRAAAAAAIRHLRAGGEPIHGWEVSMRNKTGESHNETVWFGFDHVVYQDETVVGDEQGNVTVLELSLNEIALFTGRIDDSDMDGWQDRNWEAHLETVKMAE